MSGSRKTLPILCLVLLVVTVGLWIRSHAVGDTILYDSRSAILALVHIDGGITLGLVSGPHLREYVPNPFAIAPLPANGFEWRGDKTLTVVESTVKPWLVPYLVKNRVVVWGSPPEGMWNAFKLDLAYTPAYVFCTIGVPTWFLAFAFALSCVLLRWAPLRRYLRRHRGLCIACGYDLTGNESGVCPECGTPSGAMP